ncbi:tripartite tricarboxylate transporter substrate binding protein [Bordetella sp. BOR01]|uniref:tripartite tricarboxylate transporter substrate binding protein n=1 Tax=Bordetella sp. BOR01 TaxID=2854779 RepID=UPI001C44CAF7|nr:tripartite tricarboxylate transporter substrate binding protein [Bordetella sp. BOR01]MBV7483792.1 tripartite tricarboxylate transporter substrate binding protein [Bordetella sp. BOR01]
MAQPRIARPARHLIAALLWAAALGLFWCGVAQAAAYPEKPIRIVVVYPPGGGIDYVARELARELNKAWNVPVVVENKPGAGTTLGTAAVAQADPDGYTLLMTDVSFSIAPSLYKTLPYDAVSDFAPVCLVNTVADILVANPAVHADSVRQLIDLAKAKPGSLVYASAGNGTLNHLAPEMLKAAAGIDMVHVPYKGAIAAMNDVMAGRGQVYIGALISAVPLIQAGRLKPLAVTGAHRSPLLPEVPTMIESGVAGYDVASWYGLLAPAGTPAATIRKINREVVRIAQQQGFRDAMTRNGNEVVASTPAEFSRFLQGEIDKWGQAVQAAGATVD